MAARITTSEWLSENAGNFYNDAVIDPYMLERAEVMRSGFRSVCEK